jgi:hypothetical protein
MSLIPGWLWLAGGAALLAGAALWHDSAVDDARIRDEAVGAARVQAKWNAADAEAEKVAAKAAADNLNEERRRQAAMQKEIDDATASLDAARRDADAARRASAGLRRAVDDRVDAAARFCAAATNPAAAAAGAAANGRLLAEVFGELDDEAGALAQEADRRGIAGLACERAYDSLTTTNAQGGQP